MFLTYPLSCYAGCGVPHEIYKDANFRRRSDGNSEAMANYSEVPRNFLDKLHNLAAVGTFITLRKALEITEK